LPACGGGSEPAKAPEPKAPAVAESEIQRFFPLKDNTVFAYDTQVEDTGEKGVLMMQVRVARTGFFEVNVAGRVKRVERAPDGIRLMTGGYLLQGPIEIGHTFRGAMGTVGITKVDQIVEVPAGKFVGCLQTVEEPISKASRVTTWFCPDVGMTELIVEQKSEAGYQRESAQLKSFGLSVDLEDLVSDAEAQ
jgi:hypothetical protein